MLIVNIQTIAAQIICQFKKKNQIKMNNSQSCKCCWDAFPVWSLEKAGDSQETDDICPQNKSIYSSLDLQSFYSFHSNIKHICTSNDIPMMPTSQSCIAHRYTATQTHLDGKGTVCRLLILFAGRRKDISLFHQLFFVSIL